MTSSKAMIVYIMAFATFSYLSQAADLVAPNSLTDGQSLTEGKWTFLNSGCALRLSQNGQTVMATGGVDGTCTLNMGTDGELVFVPGSDGLVVYTYRTASVLGGVIDSYELHLVNDGSLSIDRSDSSVVLQIHSS